MGAADLLTVIGSDPTKLEEVAKHLKFCTKCTGYVASDLKIITEQLQEIADFVRCCREIARNCLTVASGKFYPPLSEIQCGRKGDLPRPQTPLSVILPPAEKIKTFETAGPVTPHSTPNVRAGSRISMDRNSKSLASSFKESRKPSAALYPAPAGSAEPNAVDCTCSKGGKVPPCGANYPDAALASVLESDSKSRGGATGPSIRSIEVKIVDRGSKVKAEPVISRKPGSSSSSCASVRSRRSSRIKSEHSSGGSARSRREDEVSVKAEQEERRSVKAEQDERRSVRAEEEERRSVRAEEEERRSVRAEEEEEKRPVKAELEGRGSGRVEQEPETVIKVRREGEGSTIALYVIDEVDEVRLMIVCIRELEVLRDLFPFVVSLIDEIVIILQHFKGCSFCLNEIRPSLPDILKQIQELNKFLIQQRGQRYIWPNDYEYLKRDSARRSLLETVSKRVSEEGESKLRSGSTASAKSSHRSERGSAGSGGKVGTVKKGEKREEDTGGRRRTTQVQEVKEEGEEIVILERDHTVGEWSQDRTSLKSTERGSRFDFPSEEEGDRRVSRPDKTPKVEYSEAKPEESDTGHRGTRTEVQNQYEYGRQNSGYQVEEEYEERQEEDILEKGEVRGPKPEKDTVSRSDEEGGKPPKSKVKPRKEKRPEGEEEKHEGEISEEEEEEEEEEGGVGEETEAKVAERKPEREGVSKEADSSKGTTVTGSQKTQKPVSEESRVIQSTAKEPQAVLQVVEEVKETNEVQKNQKVVVQEIREQEVKSAGSQALVIVELTPRPDVSKQKLAKVDILKKEEEEVISSRKVKVVQQLVDHNEPTEGEKVAPSHKDPIAVTTKFGESNKTSTEKPKGDDQEEEGYGSARSSKQVVVISQVKPVDESKEDFQATLEDTEGTKGTEGAEGEEGTEGTDVKEENSQESFKSVLPEEEEEEVTTEEELDEMAQRKLSELGLEVKELKDIMLEVHKNQIELSKVLLEKGILSPSLVHLTDPKILSPEKSVIQEAKKTIGEAQVSASKITLTDLQTTVDDLKKRCKMKNRMVVALLKGLRSNIPKERWEEMIEFMFDDSTSVMDLDPQKVADFLRRSSAVLGAGEKESGRDDTASTEEGNEGNEGNELMYDALEEQQTKRKDPDETESEVEEEERESEAESKETEKGETEPEPEPETDTEQEEQEEQKPRDRWSETMQEVVPIEGTGQSEVMVIIPNQEHSLILEEANRAIAAAQKPIEPDMVVKPREIIGEGLPLDKDMEGKLNSLNKKITALAADNDMLMTKINNLTNCINQMLDEKDKLNRVVQDLTKDEKADSSGKATTINLTIHIGDRGEISTVMRPQSKESEKKMQDGPCQKALEMAQPEEEEETEERVNAVSEKPDISKVTEKEEEEQKEDKYATETDSEGDLDTDRKPINTREATSKPDLVPSSEDESEAYMPPETQETVPPVEPGGYDHYDHPEVSDVITNAIEKLDQRVRNIKDIVMTIKLKNDRMETLVDRLTEEALGNNVMFEDMEKRLAKIARQSPAFRNRT